MNDKTVITQNTPHKVTVAEGSTHAARPSVTRGQGGGPAVIDTSGNIQKAPTLKTPVRGVHGFDDAAPAAATGRAHFGTQAPRAHLHATPTDPEHALLEDWTLSPALVERIDELRLKNAHIDKQLDQLSSPFPKARA